MSVNPGFGGQHFIDEPAQEDRRDPQDDRRERARDRPGGRRRRRSPTPRGAASRRAPMRWSRAPRRSAAGRTATPPTSPRCGADERRAIPIRATPDGDRGGQAADPRSAATRGLSLAERLAERFHRLTWRTPLHTHAAEGPLSAEADRGARRSGASATSARGQALLDGRSSLPRRERARSTRSTSRGATGHAVRRSSPQLRLAARPVDASRRARRARRSPRR